MRRSLCLGRLFIAFLLFSSLCIAQSAVKERTLIVNGQGGRAMIYEIDGRAYVDIATLAQIANAQLRINGNEIILNIGSEQVTATAAHDQQVSSDALSADFMNSSIRAVGLMKEWGTVLALAVTKGIPGDGSRLMLPRDRAAEAVRLANVAVSTPADREAMQLVTNQFNNVKSWHDQLLKARKNMSTANYSMSEDALNRDPLFQKIAACSDFLSTMLPNGQYFDNSSCH